MSRALFSQFFGELVCAQKIGNFPIPKNGNFKNELHMPSKNADLLIKICVMATLVKNTQQQYQHNMFINYLLMLE